MGKMNIDKMLNSKVLFPRTEKGRKIAVINQRPFVIFCAIYIRNDKQKSNEKKKALAQIPLNICKMVNGYVTKELFNLDD